MAINQQQQENLFKGLGLFIEAFRPYLVTVLIQESGDRWPAKFVESLTPDQKIKWNQGLKNGSQPETLIDFPHLKSFAIQNKTLLKIDFERKVNDLPNWLGEIYEVRNKIAHFQEIEDDEVTKAWIHMKSIANILKMDELENEIKRLREGKTSATVSKNTNNQNHLAPWFRIVTPHLDIKQGRLDESVFAANLAEVALGNGREIYNNPVVFFSKTFLTKGIKSIAKRVVQGLNGGQDAQNRVVSLQTGFGGGKTHTLISLYHLAKWGKKITQSEYTKELIDTTGQPNFDSANIAVFTNTTNDPAQGRMVDGINIKTLWGELAYQLGGKAAYEIIRVNDEKMVAPKGLFKAVLEKSKPALILIDELADYCVSASAVKVEASNLSDQTISFMQELTEAVSGTDNCVMIATLPASAQELASSPVSSQILTALENRIIRVGANLKPVDDEEIFEVVRRRLFEDLGTPDEIETVISAYAQLYQSLASEIPSYALKSEYKERLRKSYPFHPELIDMFRLRWASNPYFQRTRGVLRILAAIVSDLWKRQSSLVGSQYLIHTSDIVLSNTEALTSQITILNGSGWDSVINADVSGSASNAFRIDNDVKELGNNNITQGIAVTILLGTFGSKGQNKGVGIDEIKFCMIKPESFNHNDINAALDRIKNSAHYLYSNQNKFWFDTIPNINILINQVKGDIKSEDIIAEILKRIKEKTNAISFPKIITDPSEDIPEQTKPTLVILSPKYLAKPNEVNGITKPIIEKLATKKGNSERIYRNTILFLVCSEMGIGKLNDDIRNYLAYNKVSAEYNSQLNPEQKNEIRRKIDEHNKQSDISLVLAYCLVMKYSAIKENDALKIGIETITIKQYKDTIDNQINSNIISALKDEEWLLDSIGLNTLKNNNLLPTPQKSIKTKDVYEAFIRYNDKPMITSSDAITQSLLRYCLNGEFCIASGNGESFNKYYIQENVPFFDINDEIYWLVDKSLKPAVIPSSNTTIPIIGVNEKGSPTFTQPKISDSKDATPQTVTKFNSIKVSGTITDKLLYAQLMNYFIVPFKDNNIEIEVSFKISSTPNMQIDESKQQYKSAKEAARQLGLNFEEE